MRLHGKTAVVTGGGSGFGAGIAAAFAREGAGVAVVDVDGKAADSIAEVVGGVGYRCDVTNFAQVKAMIADVEGAFGGIDIYVNNAGITHPRGPLEDVTESDFDRVFNVNAKAVYLSAREIVPRMKARGAGAILNIASTAGVSPRAGLNWYNASKGWMITATKTMAVELAMHGIRVNAINPVAGETPLLPSFMGEDTPEMRKAFLATIPMGRFSTPDDIGAAAVFLCSDEAALVTGVAMEVDGGRCL